MASSSTTPLGSDDARDLKRLKKQNERLKADLEHTRRQLARALDRIDELEIDLDTEKQANPANHPDISATKFSWGVLPKESGPPAAR
jgi:hypothetical protein